MSANGSFTADAQGEQRTPHSLRLSGERYDFIIAGGGAAGLSLALHLARSSLRDRSIVIIDQNAEARSDRTWSFWTNRPTLFDEAVCRSWNRLRIVYGDAEKVIDLGGYRYNMIRDIDLYRFARRELSAQANVTFVEGHVNRIEDGVDEARVIAGRHTFTGQWVFDSTFGPSGNIPDPARYHDLKMHFKGWEIETSTPAFDPQAATFLDFRTPQKQSVRFFYVLPLSERRALVEYTLISPAVLRSGEYEQVLRAYLEQTLGIPEYRLVREEGGVLPLTDRPFARRLGQRIMAIGAKGGRVKPTTGYAFTRIQRDSAAILQSLLNAGHPFDVPEDSARYRLYDALMLDIMSRHGEAVQSIFGALFKHNPVDRVFRFLDETGSVWENLALIATLPPRLFLQAIPRLAERRSAPSNRGRVEAVNG